MSLHDLDAQARRWLLQLRSGQATTADLDAFRRWQARSADHAQAFERARTAWRQVGPLGRVWRARQAQTQVRARSAPARPDRRLFLAAACGSAAAVTVAGLLHPPLALWPSLPELAADYHTGIGEQRRIALAGNGHVQLNTRSRLDVRRHGAGTQIRLLSGEAAVLRRGDGDVEIVAGAGRIRLLNGEIGVRIDGTQVCVACLDGQAELMHPSGVVRLSAAQQRRYGDTGIEPATPADAQGAWAWREGVLVFRDTPLPEVVAEINRYRRGRVIVLDDTLRARRVSGRFAIARLDDAIDRIRESFGARARKLPGEVLLLG